MTAQLPPPTVTVHEGEIAYGNTLTQDVARRHAVQIETSLLSLEQAIQDLPSGELKSRLQYRALRLHNHLGRSGQALNDHFQTAQISPNSAGGDKEPPGSDQQLVQDA